MIDIKGQQFGRLTAVEFSHLNSSRHAVWKCKCECNSEKEVLVESRYLRNGQIRGCGCMRYQTGDRSKTWKGIGELSKTQYSKIKADAKKRKIPFSVSHEFLWDLFKKQQRRCSLSGEPLTFNTKVHTSDGTASLDRIDSKKGYVSGNVQWVHKDINFMKSTMTMERFQELVEKVHEQFLRV